MGRLVVEQMRDVMAEVLGEPGRVCAAGTGRGRAAPLAGQPSQVCDGEGLGAGDGWE